MEVDRPRFKPSTVWVASERFTVMPRCGALSSVAISPSVRLSVVCLAAPSLTTANFRAMVILQRTNRKPRA